MDAVPTDPRTRYADTALGATLGGVSSERLYQ
jgi:hypothetical protein